MSITSHASSNGNELTIKVQGRFDFSSLQLFRNAYEKTDKKADSYIVDLGESDYLDSSALGMLLALRDYAGGFLEAEKGYKEILNLDPTNADAMHLLGVLALQNGKVDDAVELIQLAIEINPHAAPFYTNLGTAYKTSGQSKKAIQCFEKAIDLKENTFEAHNNLAQSLFELGNLSSAQEHYEKALLLKDKSPDAYNNLGKCYLKQKQFDRAATCFRQAINLHPKYGDAYNHFGEVMLAKLQYDTAMEYFNQALKFKPTFPGAHTNIANLLAAENDLEGAIYHYELALKQSAVYSPAHTGMGKLLAKQGLISPAIDSFKKAISLKAEDTTNYYLLSELYFLMGDNETAIITLTHALAIRPDANNYLLLAKILYKVGNVDTAQNHLDKALEIEPNLLEANILLARILVDYNYLTSARKVLEIVLKVKPSHTTAISLLAYTHLKASNLNEVAQLSYQLKYELADCITHEKPLGIDPLISMRLELPPIIQQKIATEHAEQFKILRLKHQYKQYKLRIGYLSPDFSDSAAGLLIRSIFSYHNRNQFEIYGYSLRESHSGIRHKIEQSCDHFIQLENLNPLDAARQIHQDGIHILVDLAGYQKNARPEILALKPAPIQCQMLGFPGTLGGDLVDYYITQINVIHSELKKYFSEKMIYLPETPFATAPYTQPNHTLSRADYGLPEDKFVFCCLCENERITPALFTTWLHILKGSKNAVLWIIANNDEVKFNLKHLAIAETIDPNRLIFSEDPPLNNNWQHTLADLWLDTFSCSSAASAIMALWSGLPILTMAGSLPHARTASAYLQAANMPELIVDSIEAYKKSAIGLYNSPERIKQIRQKLLTERYRSPLFYPERFIHYLEKAYQTIWDRYDSCEPPADIQVPPIKEERLAAT